MKKFILSTSAFLVLILLVSPLYAKSKKGHKKHSKKAHIAVGYESIVHPVKLSNTNENRQLLCLADNIYFEGRGESVKGQTEIGYVTIARAKSGLYPDSICRVVKQEGQFSWYKKNKRYKIKDPESWKEALAIARGVRIGVLPNRYKGAMYFHAKRVRPKWARHMKLVGAAGNHKFYYKRPRS